MIRNWALAALVALASTTHAEWVEVTGSHRSTIYVDPATIEKHGDVRRFLSLTNLVEPDKDGNMSHRNIEEHNCKEERYRSFQAEYFSGPMASGRLTRTQSQPSTWRYAPPNSVGLEILAFVCKP